jgi:large subunit ribosomal protein L18
MAKSKKYVVQFRRKREGKTDYKKRLHLLIGQKPRVIVRKSLKNVSMQIATYTATGDKIMVAAHTNELKKYGWKAGKSNLSAAYLCGFLLGKKALAKKITQGIADLGLYPPIKGSKLYAGLKGIKDAGVSINIGTKILPSDDRIAGKHIADFATSIKDSDAYKKLFSAYLKNSCDPQKLPEHMEAVKQKIAQ